MALKLRKDVKKSSYYVWFLGAKESKGLRGTEFIVPVIKHLEDREKDIEPFKVTLQVSHKGLKIIQNVVSQNQKNSKPKHETIKHFIPHNTITCVYQQEDVIACILLLFNPVTKCPLHVHAYRCDSLETATLLKNQLQTLIERPENQKKFAEIEGRLKPQKELKKVDSSIGSDTGTSTRESESSEERYVGETTRVTTLYDSVAAELRAKLGKKSSPILLPPRDYDTVHRTKGNLTGIELRRCLNANIVGPNVKGRRIESSGGSSGIGSDHPPSPESPDAPDSRFNTLDNQSTSDEDWNGDPAESTIYLMHQPTQIIKSRDKSPEANPRFSRYAEPQLPSTEKVNYRSNKNVRDETQKYLERPVAKYTEKNFIKRQKSPENKNYEKQFVERQKSLEKDRHSKDMDKKENYRDNRYYYHEEDDREKYYASERYHEKEKPINDISNKMEKAQMYFDDDGFDENIRYRQKQDYDKERSRYTYEEEEYFKNKQQPMPKVRQRYPSEDSKFYKEAFRHDNSGPKSPSRSSPDNSRYYSEPEIKPRSMPRPTQKDNFLKSQSRSDREEKSLKSQDYYDDGRKNCQIRSGTPSSDDIKAPSDRFKNAKEKFMLMERERLEHEKRRPEPPISPTNVKDKPFAKRYNDVAYSNGRERYYNERREHHFEEPKPTPLPRHIPEEVRYRERNRDMHCDMRERGRDSPLVRYRNNDKYDPKRKSMFSLIEEEHRKNSNEIAKELKRRSYMDGGNYDDDVDIIPNDRDRYYQELPESERFIENYSKSSVEIDKVGEMKYDQKFVKNQKQSKNSAGYRHSYAEPKLRMEKDLRKNLSEMLHRTNSSVGNNGRVGIASVHPY
ncbi:uncharacterized protein [Diabrotica undecimpunctata]|uniref:uncharacterized protein n=1 Tax=Diabrotica undecimpunctata TaxID=50387 RepID=UPI003B6409AD